MSRPVRATSPLRADVLRQIIAPIAVLGCRGFWQISSSLVLRVSMTRAGTRDVRASLDPRRHQPQLLQEPEVVTHRAVLHDLAGANAEQMHLALAHGARSRWCPDERASQHGERRRAQMRADQGDLAHDGVSLGDRRAHLESEIGERGEQALSDATKPFLADPPAVVRRIVGVRSGEGNRVVRVGAFDVTPDGVEYLIAHRAPPNKSPLRLPAPDTTRIERI